MAECWQSWLISLVNSATQVPFQNSILSSVPYIFMWVSALGSGWFADWLIKGKYLTVTSTRKVFTAIAHFGPALTLVAATHAGCNRGFVVVLFTITMTFMGAFYPGMKINALDLSPNYAGSVMAIVNGTGALCGVFTPYLVGLLTPNVSIPFCLLHCNNRLK